eukprot:12249378-Karenia_brevis.AAC.1
MNEIRRGKDPKLHLGTNEPSAPCGPRDQPKVTSMNETRRGTDVKLHLGVIALATLGAQGPT